MEHECVFEDEHNLRTIICTVGDCGEYNPRAYIEYCPEGCCGDWQWIDD